MSNRHIALSRRNFLLASAAAATMSRPIASAATTRPDRLIVCIARGGWDTSFALDPKLESPHVEGPAALHETVDDVEYLAEFHDGQVLQCNDYRRPAVRSFYEKWGDRMSVINGQFVGSITHESCRLRILTGTADPAGSDFASIFGYEFGSDLPLGSVDFSASSFPGKLSATTGRVGHRNQLRALLDPTQFLQPPPGSSQPLPLRTLDQGDQDLIEEYMQSRAQRMRDRVSDGGANDHHLDAFFESIDRRRRVLEVGPDFMGDLVIGEEPSLLEQTRLGVDLLKKGLCRAVTLKDSGDWDTHRNIGEQHKLHEHFFSVVDKMLDELIAADMFERTLVVVCSEMGRTPKVNGNGGKDHWGHTTQLLLGGGVAGGRRLGGTDEYGEGQWVDYASGDVFAGGERIKYDNLVAAILAQLDIDPQKWLPNVTPFNAWSTL